jgi:farnesyl-diphosphate farnesyltransferase
MSDDELQSHFLQGVSRTFALTIPQLPGRLHRVVANAYLLCRIADTIEDDPALDPEQTRVFADRFIEVVAGTAAPEPFAADLGPLLSEQSLPQERELIWHTPRVIGITRTFNAGQQAALATCVRIMSRGMAEFQQNASRAGLTDLRELDRYCYHVAGVVGECLTRLFCDYSPQIARQRTALMGLAVSFGQGLQMTNIIKDLWDDYARGVCWLPRAVFAEQGFDLHDLAPGQASSGFEAGLVRLIAVAHGHLRNALHYTLLLPRAEVGLRKFCLWALGMAVLTLRNINNNRTFTAGSEVKISRRSVRTIVALSRLTASQDTVLRALFAIATAPLPRLAAGMERLVTVEAPPERPGARTP